MLLPVPASTVSGAYSCHRMVLLLLPSLWSMYSAPLLTLMHVADVSACLNRPRSLQLVPDAVAGFSTIFDTWTWCLIYSPGAGACFHHS